MPYSKNDVPDRIKGLPEHAREIWISAYNSAYEQYNKDEEKSNAVAWSAVEKAGYKKNEKDEWIKAEMNASRVVYNLPSSIKFEEVKAQKFIKEVITEGEWIHPQNPDIKFQVTKQRMLEWVKNFKNKVLDIVPTPLGHSDKAIDNAGIIEDLYIAENPKDTSKMSLFAKFNILLEDIASKIGKTILGNSIAVEPNFLDTKTGENMGEVLVHIALTNQPHIQGLDNYIPVYASRNVENIILFEKGGEIKMEELEKVKAEVASLTKLVSDSKIEFEKTLKAKEEAIIELQRNNRKTEVVNKIDTLIREGKMKVEDKEEMVKFGVENIAGFDAFALHLSKMPSKVELGQRGITSMDESGSIPAQSELSTISSDYLTRKGMGMVGFDKTGFEGKLKNWLERFEKSGKKFLADRTSYLKGGITLNRTVNPEIRF